MCNPGKSTILPASRGLTQVFLLAKEHQNEPIIKKLNGKATRKNNGLPMSCNPWQNPSLHPSCRLTLGTAWSLLIATFFPDQTSPAPSPNKPLFVGEALQCSEQPCCPSLDPVQQLCTLLVLGAPHLDAVLQAGPHKGRDDSLYPDILLFQKTARSCQNAKM